ncbi:MAG: hypothetical protein ACC630_00605 [Nitrospinota bacterium]
MAIRRQYLDIDFEGFSPISMHGLLYSTFDEDKSPLIFKKEIDNQLIAKVPFNNHIKHYLCKIRKEQPLKLTQKGNLPRKFCRELLEHEFFVDESSEKYLKKHPLMKERDSYYINLINILTELCGFTKKVHGEKTLTNKCIKLLELESSYELYRNIFLAYTGKFNWGYSDLYPESWIIQGGFGFSIFLVQKYGDKARDISFYSEKFLGAFPITIHEFSDNPYFSREHQFQNCYYIRMFERFLYIFGLIDMERKGKFPSEERIIKKKKLLDQIIKWKI